MRYKICELESLYRRISNKRDAVSILSDFGMCTKSEASLLVDVFEGRAEPMPDDPPMPQPPYNFSEWMW